MHRFLKRLLWVATTLGFGAVAYALMRNEGERVLRAGSPERGGEEPRPRPVPRTSERPVPEAPPAVEVEVARCVAVTKSGVRCAREPVRGSEYCWQHA